MGKIESAAFVMQPLHLSGLKVPLQGIEPCTFFYQKNEVTDSSAHIKMLHRMT